MSHDDLFDGISPRKVSEILKQYGFKTSKSNGRNEYKDIDPKQLREVETAYGLDLEIKSEVSRRYTLWNVPLSMDIYL
ncbi:MAG: hypothetical protein P8N76_08300 [Pirellulaceae bacterium]|nr:hypothetical protein [Pirellulaceae bacterium]